MRNLIKLMLFTVFLIASPNFCQAAASFTFDKFLPHNTHPEKYSLILLDSDFVPAGVKGDWAKHPEFTDIGIYLNQGFISDKDISFKSPEEEKEKTKCLIIKKLKDISIGKQGYLIRLFKKDNSSKVETLMATLAGEVIEPKETFSLNASLLILPQNHHQSMVYAFGLWEGIINSYAKIPLWGLRILASEKFFSEATIKEISARQYRRANPSTKTERVPELGNIEEFDIEVGSEGIEYLKALPNKTYKASHTLFGRDHIQFSANTQTKDVKEKGATIKHLITMAQNFFGLYTSDEFKVHDSFKLFLDQMLGKSEEERKICEVLDQKLMESIRIKGKSSCGDGKTLHTPVYVHDDLWRLYHTRKLLFGDEEDRYSETLLDLLQNKKYNLDSKINIKDALGKKPVKETARRFLYSLPLEHDGSFYRFDRGYWYKVDKSRFESIKGILRKIRMLPNAISLLPYEFIDTHRKDEGVDYKEANYNNRIVQEILKKGGEASCLDRICVSLAKSGDRFEFGDILIYKNKRFYIIHIKRAGAGLSHHNEQVARCAEYLATDLQKKGEQNILLQGVIKDLYYSQGIDTKKTRNQKKRLTRGNQFRQSYDPKSPDFKAHIEKVLLKISDSKKKKDIDKFKESLSKLIDYEFFKDHKDELISALDALYDCFQEEKSKIKKTVDTEVYKDFFEAVKQAIQTQELLFSRGILKKETLKKITIVMAVVDDRKIETVLETIKNAKKKLTTLKSNKSKAKAHLRSIKEQEDKIKELEDELKKKEKDDPTGALEPKKKGPLFNNQDLWGMDRVRTLVQRRGLDFRLVTINEDTEERGETKWDCFGKLEGEDDSDDSGKDRDKDDDDDYSSTASDEGVSDSEEDESTKALKIAQKRAKDLYGKKPGFIKVMDEPYLDVCTGKKYLRIIIDGSKGDCCFHALGVKRKETIDKLKNYIDECEAIKATFPNNKLRVFLEINEYLNAVIHDSQDDKDAERDKHFNEKDFIELRVKILDLYKDLEGTKKEEIENLFNQLIEYQNKVLDWNKIKEITSAIKKMIYEANVDLINDEIKSFFGINEYLNAVIHDSQDDKDAERDRHFNEKDFIELRVKILDLYKDLEGTKKEEIENLFNQLIEYQNKVLDWNKIKEITLAIKKMIYEAKLDLVKAQEYEAFENCCVEDFAISIGDNNIVKIINDYLKSIHVLVGNGNVAKYNLSNEEIEGIKKYASLYYDENLAIKVVAAKKKTAKEEFVQKFELSPTKVKHLKYRLEFKNASPKRKKEILEDFYLTSRNWMQLETIFPLGEFLGFKARLFKIKKDNSIEETLGKKAEETECRRILYVNNNHYDLLFPL